MEFLIEKHSDTPVAKQIEDQIKLAVMMGLVRRGEMLPSIRDIEKQTGVNRNQIHKAYLSLRRSGLLVLTRGKGSVIAAATECPEKINEDCRRLSKSVIARVRRLNLSPTAFARYLSRRAQEDERNDPYILYVDVQREMAEQTAMEISKWWQVPVIGLTFEEAKRFAEKKAGGLSILVNHVMFGSLRSMIPDHGSSVIPIEMRYSPKTIRKLARIKPNSLIQAILLPHPSHRLRFILVQLQQLIKSPGIRIVPVFMQNGTDIGALLQNKEYDYCIIGTGVRGHVPREMRQHSRIVQLEPKIDPASLEVARIRAGVVI